MKTEIWLPVPIKEYCKLYKVSNFGRVMSLNYNHTGQIKILKPLKTTKGYFSVILYKNGIGKNFRVHRLVAQAFIPNLLNKPQVNHIDEDKTNNFVGTPENDFRDGNLEWCDNKENSNHGTRNERISKTMTNGKQSKPVLQFSLSGEFIREWPSTKECGRNGFDHRGVVACCNGKQKSAYGFRWKYKKEVV